MIFRESVDLVIDGADFYRSIENASPAKLKNGWCDFARLAFQQAKESVENPTIGKIWYFDPRSKGRMEESYGSIRRRKLWSGRLERANVTQFPVRALRDSRYPQGSPDCFGKITQDDPLSLFRQELSPNVLVLSSPTSPLASYMQLLKDEIGFAKGTLLPPDESEAGTLTHDELEQVQLRGSENDVAWCEYRTSKQDSHLIEALWDRWQAEIHEAIQKRMLAFDQARFSKLLSCLARDPAREQNFLTRAETDLRPFIEEIRRENRRLAATPECTRFCLHRAVREVANAECSRMFPPDQQPREHPWHVDVHQGCQRDTENWPLDVCDEIEEKCERLRECGPELTAPLVKSLEGDDASNLKRLKLSKAGGAYRIVFAHVEQKTFLLLAGGKKGGLNDRRFYRDLIATASKRIKCT